MVGAENQPKGQEEEEPGDGGAPGEGGSIPVFCPQLIDHHREGVSDAQLHQDGQDAPVSSAHFPEGGDDGHQARWGEEVDEEEGEGCQLRMGGVELLEHLGDDFHDARPSCVGEDAQGSRGLFLGEGGGEDGHGAAPITQPDGAEEPGEEASDVGEDGAVHILAHEMEVPGEGMEGPQEEAGEENDGSRLDAEILSPVPGVEEKVFHGGHVVGGEFQDEGGWLPGEGAGLLQGDARQDDDGHADEIHAGSHPDGAGEAGQGWLHWENLVLSPKDHKIQLATHLQIVLYLDQEM